MLFTIGVAGPSASGKSSVVERIVSSIGSHRCALLCLDYFYHGLPAEADPLDYDFDSPNAFNFGACVDALARLSRGHSVTVPTYDYATHARDGAPVTVPSTTEVLILEGILTFYTGALRDLLHLKVFVDEDADVCLCRRLRRDVVERARTVESVLTQYERTVKPALDNFVHPQKRHADIVVQRGVENVTAIDLLVKHIALKLDKERGMRRAFSNLHEMPLSGQVRALHTCFRSADVPRDHFVFYVDRMIRLLVEAALGMLPFTSRNVATPTGELYQGFAFASNIAAVSISPGGEAMERALREVVREVRIGKVVVNRRAEEKREQEATATEGPLSVAPPLSPSISSPASTREAERVGDAQKVSDDRDSRAHRQSQLRDSADVSGAHATPRNRHEREPGDGGNDDGAATRAAAAAATVATTAAAAAGALPDSTPGTVPATAATASNAVNADYDADADAEPYLPSLERQRQCMHQRHQRNIEYRSYPPNIATRNVLVLLPVLDTGATLHAVLDDLVTTRECRQSNIIVLSLIASPEAVATVCGRWPAVRVLVSAVDRGVNDDGLVVPGIGWFADRYFGY